MDKKNLFDPAGFSMPKQCVSIVVFYIHIPYASTVCTLGTHSRCVNLAVR